MLTVFSSIGAGWPVSQAGGGQSLGELAVVAIGAYFAYLTVTLVFGGFVLLVAGDRVRRLDTRLGQSTLRATGLGFGGIFASVGGFVLFALGIVVLVELGAPEAVGLVLLVPVFVLALAVLFISAVGVIIAGSWLLRTVKQQAEPNLWVALVVGAVSINIALLVPMVNVGVGLLLIALPVGGLIDAWWTAR